MNRPQSILFALLCAVCVSCGFDPGPYEGNWHCTGTEPYSDPTTVFHPEFYPTGKLILRSTGPIPITTGKYWYSGNTLYMQFEQEPFKYTSYFPHPDSMQLVPDSTVWIGTVPTYYFVRL